MPTVNRSCARRRCAIRGTSRSCGTRSEPARCTRSRPTTARSPSPIAGPGSAPAKQAGPTSPRSPAGSPASRRAWDWCGKASSPAASRVPTGCGCVPKRRRARSACGPRRATFGSGPTPTWWCGTRRAAQSLDASALHMAVDHSPYAGTVVTGWPEVVLARGDVIARDGRYVGEPERGRFVSRTPRSSYATPELNPPGIAKPISRRRRRYATASRSNGRCSSSRRSSGRRSGRWPSTIARSGSQIRDSSSS